MSAVLDRSLKQTNWSTVVMFALGFWLSGSLILDSVILPTLSVAGMMSEKAFPLAGYLLFGIFNRVELVCAALVLTGCLVFYRNHILPSRQQKLSVFLSAILLVIALIYTYFLTPQMSGVGLQLNFFEATNTMPALMISLHEGYWFLEVIKLLVATTLLSWFYRNYRAVA